MRTRSSSTLLFVTLLTATAAAAEKSEAQRIAEGDIVLTTRAQPGSDVPVITIKAVIDVAPEQVWALIDNCADYKNVMPRMSESEELERVGNRVRCRTKINAPWPVADLESTTWAEHIVEPGKRWVRKWTLDKGNFDRNEGSWVLVPYGDGSRTLVTYEAATKPQSSVPGFIRKMAQQSSLPDIIHNMRKALIKQG